MSTFDPTVIIPTAGNGSRLGKYSKNLNKALLPYNQVPILGHIIECWPENTNFIIPTGYLSQQVKDFCALTYPDKNITFLDVDWESEKAGTGFTLLQCEDYVKGSFWYVPCDTYFNENVIQNKSDEDLFFVKQVPENSSVLYTMFLCENDRIKNVSFKKFKLKNWKAFSGLMYIADNEKFFSRLKNLNNNEFIDAIKLQSRCVDLESWIDFGSYQNYESKLNEGKNFDFSKENEITYICNSNVTKWWTDKSIAEKKYNKTTQNKNIFPQNCRFINNYMSYDLFEGKTLYEINDFKHFNNLLSWLEKNVWIENSNDITLESIMFYKNKTIDRVNKFLNKYPNIENVDFVDNVRVKNLSYYLDSIDWDFLSTETLPGFIHGDLQFDNIIMNNSGEFKIIDWRHEFAGLVETGDIYYDLAKMLGGFVINYLDVKNNKFGIQITNGSVNLNTPNIKDYRKYEVFLRQYVLNKGWNFDKIKLLVPIIFLNMSPLHVAPFDKFLWYLSIKLFQEIENERD